MPVLSRTRLASPLVSVSAAAFRTTAREHISSYTNVDILLRLGMHKHMRENAGERQNGTLRKAAAKQC